MCTAVPGAVTGGISCQSFNQRRRKRRMHRVISQREGVGTLLRLLMDRYKPWEMKDGETSAADMCYCTCLLLEKLPHFLYLILLPLIVYIAWTAIVDVWIMLLKCTRWRMMTEKSHTPDINFVNILWTSRILSAIVMSYGYYINKCHITFCTLSKHYTDSF